MPPKLLIIAGPTASGKKKLALKTAERFNGEIVSADSRKVYRYLDIGTAKPSMEDRNRIPHHLIDIVNPDEPFSAGEWVSRASCTVREILARGRLPVISGGTGFYIGAFREGLSEGIEPEPGVRKKLEEKLACDGAHAMYSELASIDPARAGELHENDTFRVLRALEVFYSTGRTFTELRKNGKGGGDYDYFTIGVTMPRDILYRRIDERVDDMVSKGLVDELKNVLAMGYSPDLPSLDTVGYKEWFSYLDGTESFEECLEKVKRNSRRYAKRQLTWFRARPNVEWVNATNRDEVGRKLGEVYIWLDMN